MAYWLVGVLYNGAYKNFLAGFQCNFQGYLKSTRFYFTDTGNLLLSHVFQLYFPTSNKQDICL